jgi:hypothetical protein
MMTGMSEAGYETLIFTQTFLETFASRDFTRAERRAFQDALKYLDADERHPSLRVHELQGRQQGTWSASASDKLRMTFVRVPGGRKVMLVCSHHYDR